MSVPTLPGREIAVRLATMLVLLLALHAWAGAATAPTVTAVTPADGSTGVDCGTTLTITFSAAMDRAATGAAVSLVDGASHPVAVTVQWPTSTQVTLRPCGVLADTTSYTVAVAGTAAASDGTSIGAPVSAAFTTTTRLQSGIPLTTPVTALLHLGAATEHVVSYPGGGQSLLWDHILNSGMGPEELQQPAPGLTIPFQFGPNGLTMTWTAVTSLTGAWDSDADGTMCDYLGLPLLVPSDRTAELIVGGGASYYAWIDGAVITASGITGTSPTFPLPQGQHLLVLKVQGGNETVTIANASGVSFGDLRETMTGGIAPTITTTYPATGTGNVPITDDVILAFSEPMRTIATTMAAIASPGGGATGSWSWSDPCHLCFRPSTPLAVQTTYTVTLDAASCLDLPGNSLAGSTTMSFTTWSGLGPVPTGIVPASASSGTTVSVLLAAANLTTVTTCPVGSLPFLGHRYLYQQAGLDFADAQAACVATGGHLATIHSAAEDDLVWRMGGRIDNWIGFDDLADGQTWVWVTGETIPYLNWAPGEPMNFGVIENYGAYFWGMQWNSDEDGGRRYVEQCDTQLPLATLTAAGRPPLPVALSDTSSTGAAGTISCIGVLPGTYDLTITNPDGTAASLPGAFTVTRPAAPSVTAVAGDGTVSLGWSGYPLGTSMLVVRRPAASSPTAPTDGTAPTVGSALGQGVIIALTASSGWIDGGIPPSTTVVYDVYAVTGGEIFSSAGTIAATTPAFTPVPPQLLSVTPSTSQRVVTTLTLSGSGFDLGAAYPSGSVVIGTHAYEHVGSMTWTQAVAAAAAAGGTLPIIRSAADNAEVLQTVGSVNIWIGVDDPTATGHFQVIDGTPLLYSNWSPGEPNEIGYETVTEMYSGSGLWNNLPPADTHETVIQFSGIAPQVQLSRSGQPTITGTVTSVSSTTVVAQVDLSQATVGAWDVSIIDPDSGTATLPAGLTVVRAPAPTVSASAGAGAAVVRWSGVTEGVGVVIRRPAGTSASQPTDGTAPVLGASLGGGIVVGVGANPVLDAPLLPQTSYAYDAYQCWTGNVYSFPGTCTTTTSALTSPDPLALAPTVAEPQPGLVGTITGLHFSADLAPPPAGATIIGSHAYLPLGSSLTWAQAAAAAQAAGGQLPRITSAGDNAEVQASCAGQDSWIDIVDPQATGHFVHADGSPLTYTNWYPGQPDNLGNETVVEMMAGPGSWNNYESGVQLSAHAQLPVLLPTVLLAQAGQPSISTSVSALSDTSITFHADLTQAAHGAWDVVVIAPDGSTGTLPGALYVDQPPVVGSDRCLTLHDDADFAISTTSSILGHFGSPCTLEAWVRATPPTTTDASVHAFAGLFNGAPASYSSPLIGMGSTDAYAHASASNWNWFTCTNSPPIVDGAWHHEAFVISPRAMDFYLDGQRIAEGDPATSMGPATMCMLLGDGGFGQNPALQLSEVRFWTAALPADVIDAWRGARATPAHPYWPSLCVDYGLNQASGSAAVDAIHGLNATLMGASAWSGGITFLTGTENTPLIGSIGGGDPDGDPVTYQLVTPPAHGQVSLVAASGAFTYVPAAGWYGTDTFTVAASDGYLASAPTQMTLFLARTDADVLTAQTATIALQPPQSYIGNLSATGSTTGSVTYAIVSKPTIGSVQLLDPATGLFLYAPPEVGPIPATYTSFTVTATDGTVTSDPATVFVQFTPFTPPTTEIQLGQTLTNAAQIPGQIIFPTSVSHVTAADLLVGNGTILDLVGSGTSYSFILEPAADGAAFVALPPGLLLDDGGAPVPEGAASVLSDRTPPTATLQSLTATAVTLVPVVITATFSEPVTNWSGGGVQVLGGIATAIHLISPQSASLTVVPTQAGTLTVTVPAGMVTDLADNPLVSATIRIPVTAGTTSTGTTGTATSTTGTATSTSGTGSGSASSTTDGSTTAGTGAGSSDGGGTASSNPPVVGSGGGCGLGGGAAFVVLVLSWRVWRRGRPRLMPPGERRRP